jgi:phosphate transport system permease protein
MAAGLAAHITLNPLIENSTITVQIIRLLLGDQSFDSVQTLVAYVLGLMLFIVILTLNFLALSIKTKLD